jgi:phosphoribosyl 1,2-cyclic phosphodiesterase
VKVTVLGSGSTGNSTLVEAGDTRVLIDAGFSGREIAERLLAIGVDPSTLAGVLITHDHGDHTRGMGVLARRHSVPIYITRRTRQVCRHLMQGSESVHEYVSSRYFRLGDLEIQPFLTVHDAADPVAVTIRAVDTGCRMGIATDLGRPTSAVRAALAGCHMLILEANHDDALLWSGPYPWSVKQRIASSHGHLSNRASAALARELHHPSLVAVALAHLSEHCNEGSLAHDAVGRALDDVGYRGRLEVARQDRPLDPVDVTALRRRAGQIQQLSLF